MKTYCVPWNAGLCSETKAVERRLAKLLVALEEHINDHICDRGKSEHNICDQVRQFKMDIINNLIADGCSVKRSCTGKWCIRIYPKTRKETTK